MVYTGPHLASLLAAQDQQRQVNLVRQGTFTVQWRAKVGSALHPDFETLVSAGEPCGSWFTDQDANWRPEAERKVDENLAQLPELPLNGYIPASCIRGLVRAWATRQGQRERMRELLGYQAPQSDRIYAGKIEFLDAWPVDPQKLSLDMVNPQEAFQVWHDSEQQGNPCSFYTLGDGEEAIPVVVAIRGIPHRKTTPEEVDEVWGWVAQALTSYGVGGRTAAGYGVITAASPLKPKRDPGHVAKTFDFTVQSQGCYGVDPDQPQLRPSHWRGWLRSWAYRFLLGVMSPDDALTTLGELFGKLEPQPAQQGSVRLVLEPGETWGVTSSGGSPYFYTWEGRLTLTAPKVIVAKILLPIMRVAVTTGGVGRGWRRPLHIFENDRRYKASRGSTVTLRHQLKDAMRLFDLSLKPESWQKNYDQWCTAVQGQWPHRFLPQQNPHAEAFSPAACAVYVVLGTDIDVVSGTEWETQKPRETRGQGMTLIYNPKYKRKNDVGGNAAQGQGGRSHCSWVSIKQTTGFVPGLGRTGQEVVCLFMGGEVPGSNHLRAQFLNDLARIEGARYLFGVRSPQLP